MAEFDYDDDWETPGNEDDTDPVDNTPISELPLPDSLPPEEIQTVLEMTTVTIVLADDGAGNTDTLEAGAPTPEGVVPVWSPVETHLAKNRWDTSSSEITKFAATDWARNENGGGGITGAQGSPDA